MKSLPNGSKNSVSIRDERGRYLKGIAGGPGRPPGSRNRLTEDFVGDLHAAWLERGREAIDRVIDERPEAFLGIVAKTIDVRRVEVGQPGEFSRLPNEQAILEKLEEKSGPQARELFEKFIRDFEKLQAEQEQRAVRSRGIARRFQIAGCGSEIRAS
jgi:hypothetical protein